MGARVVKYKFGSRVVKYKFGARAGKHKFGARAGKYKLGARVQAGGQAKERGPGKTSIVVNCKNQYMIL